MSEYRVGEVVDIEIRARVAREGGPGFLIVDYAQGPRVTLPVDHPAVTVTRVAPPEWPPRPGDLWRDRLGGMWFGVRDVRTGKTVLTPDRPVQSTPEQPPSVVMDELGPLTLVHREPEGGGRDE